MHSLPLPAFAAAVAALIALPFSIAAAGTLFLSAGLGLIIHADYVQRQCRVRLPRRQPAPAHAQFRRLAIARETHRLAA